MFGRSEAEEIYNGWATKQNLAAVTPEARASGSFDKFLIDGFKGILNALETLSQSNGSSKDGKRKTAEQTWKVIDKLLRRQGAEVAREVWKAIEKSPTLHAILETYASDYVAATTTKRKAQKKIDDARATYLSLCRIHFPVVKKDITILKMLGKGGMGGAVYLGIDEEANRYAVKHFPKRHKVETFAETPKGYREKVQHMLLDFYEARLTTTCFDYVRLGADEYLLLALGEGDVDYTKVTLADVASAFADMDKLDNYALHHFGTDLTQRAAVLHLDIHGGNLMRFNGVMRLIDFGMALVYNPDTAKKMGKVKLKDWSERRVDPNLYLTNEAGIEDQGRYTDPQSKTAKKFVDDWTGAFKAPPMVIACQGCQRQYPDGFTISECYRCGSKKLERAHLRRVDLESIAKLKGVSVSSLLQTTEKGKTLGVFTPAMYGCMVLTLVLVKEMWTALERQLDTELGLGEKAKGYQARWVVNAEVYGKARGNLHRLKGAARNEAMLVELLLLWYDELMSKALSGTEVSAKDAVQYFNRGGQKPRLVRTQSATF